MVEYSPADLNKERKKSKKSRRSDVRDVPRPKIFNGDKIFLFEKVNVYSGRGNVELWRTGFGRLVIRTFDHEYNHHADIDVIDLVNSLKSLCKRHDTSDA